MATNLRKTERSYSTDRDITVLYSEQGLRSPRGGTIDLQYFTVSADNNIPIPRGVFWVPATGGLFRALQVTKATAAKTTADNILDIYHPALFRAGDQLELNDGTLIGTIQSVDVAEGQVTLTANAAAAVPDNAELRAPGTDYLNIAGVSISSLNLNERSNDVAFYTSASVWKDRLQVWNPVIAGQLPEITIAPVP